MDLIERAIFFTIGGGLGFILGYIVARLREIKEEVDQVLDIEKSKPRVRDERGFTRFPFVADIMLLSVIVLVVYAAFASQRASNEVVAAQESIETVTECNQEFLAQLLIAVNERTTFTADQARANIELQKSQSQFLSILLANPPKSDAVRAQALRDYFASLTDFIEVNSNAARKAEENPYPTIEAFNACLEEKKEN